MVKWLDRFKRAILFSADAHFATTNAETSVWRILQLIYRDHGVRGLMTGLGARLLKVAPSCAIMITTYEVGKAYMSGS